MEFVVFTGVLLNYLIDLFFESTDFVFYYLHQSLAFITVYTKDEHK